MSAAYPVTLWLTLVHIALVLVLPFLLAGIISRTKSWWAARRGPGLFQTVYDLRRLLRKRAVISQSTTPVFRLGAYAVLACALLAMGFVPLLGAFAPLAFAQDFVAMAYLLGLGRIVLMLSAWDTGSPFEGMGAARTAAFAAFAEPAFFLLLGTLSAATGMASLAGMLGQLQHTPYYAWVVLPLALALLILLQTEAARVPVDDPQTHLELTMVHEAMLLDHSGPELAAMQYAAGLKLTLYSGLIATLLNPFDPLTDPVAALAAALGLMLALAVLVGCCESLMVRLPMRRVTHYVWLAGWLAALAALMVGVAGGGL